MAERCVFEPAWTDHCKSTDTEHGLCSEHRGKRCAGCGAVALKECSVASQFVCGAPLCPRCGPIWSADAGHSHGRPGWRSGSAVPA